MYKGNRREKNKVQTSEKVKKVVVFLRASPTGSTLEFSEAGIDFIPHSREFGLLRRIFLGQSSSLLLYLTWSHSLVETIDGRPERGLYFDSTSR